MSCLRCSCRCQAKDWWLSPRFWSSPVLSLDSQLQAVVIIRTQYSPLLKGHAFKFKHMYMQKPVLPAAKFCDNQGHGSVLLYKRHSDGMLVWAQIKLSLSYKVLSGYHGSSRLAGGVQGHYRDAQDTLSTGARSRSRCRWRIRAGLLSESDAS